MSGHKADKTDPDERWKRAATKEGLSYPEFTRLAREERADKVLDPVRGVLSGFAGMVGAAIVKDVASRVSLCKCGHPENRHVQHSGSTGRGSCGSALCGCVKYEGRSGEAKP